MAKNTNNCFEVYRVIQNKLHWINKGKQWVIANGRQVIFWKGYMETEELVQGNDISVTYAKACMS